MHRLPRVTLASGLVVLLVLLAGCTGGGGGGAGGGAPDVARQSAADGGAGGSYYANGSRVIVRTASMQVEVESFDTAFDRSQEIAAAHGGFVAGWDHQIERGWEGGTLQIRIPAENFTAARTDLAELGRLESENVRAEDFTTEYRNLGERLEDLRAEQRELQRLLEQTDDVEQARRLHDDLAELRAQIRELENQRAGIEQREALSTIHLTIHEPASDRPPRNYESAFGFDDAFLDAFYGGLTAVKYVIVFFGYAIPIGFAAVIFGGLAIVWFRLWQAVRTRLDAWLPGAADGPGLLGRLRGRGGDGPEPPEGESDE